MACFHGVSGLVCLDSFMVPLCFYYDFMLNFEWLHCGYNMSWFFSPRWDCWGWIVSADLAVFWAVWNVWLDNLEPDPWPIFRSVFCFEADLVSAKEGYTELCSLPKEVVEIQKFYCHLYVSLSVSGGTWLKIILENMVQWCDVEARQSRDQEEMVQKEDLVAQLLQLVVWTTKC